MMNRVQYLLTKLAEECNETAQRASKAIVFGLDDIQSEQLEDNAKRLVGEFCHILAYMELLRDEGYLELDEFDMEHEIEEKKKELERWYQYSVDKGMVESLSIEKPKHPTEFKWEEPAPAKGSVSHNEVREVVLPVIMLFTKSDAIVDEVDDFNKPISYRSGFIMEPVPQKIVYNGQDSIKLYSVFTSSESD